jgi:hypothetical protein
MRNKELTGSVRHRSYLIINSCKLFIGSQSALLHIAFAFKKNVIIGECEEECHPEYGHHYIQGLDHYFSNIRFNK